MNQTIPVNPSVLRWARETSGVPLDEVVRKLGRKSITIETISAWECGEGSPSYAQLEELAYQIYKRPLALFFFPEPPLEETPGQAFRTLPDHEIKMLSSRMLFLLRQAKTMQINLAELYEGGNPSKRHLIRDLKFAPDMPISEIVATIRKYFDIDLNDQCEWHSTDKAFKEWRKAFEECGVFVFKEAFGDDSFSGFSLFDEQFPIVYINNSLSHSRQVFTLFHELPHLLFRTGGIDKQHEDFVQFLQGDNKNIEVLCNHFAGAFLVPDDDFDANIRNISINDKTINDLANPDYS
jgi:Zn-dependent peptidase ImmA (M78 family)/transcriptional regulator with XRE-family HTH domain